MSEKIKILAGEKLNRFVKFTRKILSFNFFLLPNLTNNKINEKIQKGENYKRNKKRKTM